MNYLKIILAYGVVILLAISAYFILNWIFSRPVPVPIPKKDDLTLWIDELENYECRDCAYGYRRLDSNGYYSYGCLQFQKPTFLQEIIHHEFAPGASAAELDTMIHDCNIQKQLAREMIKNDKNAYLHWKTSVITRGLGLPPQ